MRAAKEVAKEVAKGARAAVTALVVLGVALGMLLLVRSSPDVEPFDPRSSASDGANGVVLLLQDLGASVDITSRAPQPGADERVFVIDDRLDDQQRRDLLAFVDAGGVAVVADPDSSLHAGAEDVGDFEPVPADSDSQIYTGNQLPADQEANVLLGDCTIGSLRSLRGVFSPDGVQFPIVNEQDHCFGDEESSFVRVRNVASGVVVGFGDNNIVTNAYLRFADNAGLVTALLAPIDGSRVRILIGASAKPSVSDVGTGDETLVDLVRPGVWMALSQLAIAFTVFCIARAIRPGRTIREPSPTPIAGNALVLATGNLMQRAHHHRRAAWLVRGEFYRQLVDHYGTSPDISIERLSALVGSRSVVDPAELQEVLRAEVNGDSSGAGDALVRLSNRIERLRALTIRSDTDRANLSKPGTQRAKEQGPDERHQR